MPPTSSSPSTDQTGEYNGSNEDIRQPPCLASPRSCAGEQASAAQTNVAVAANFTDAAKEIAAAFKAKTGHEAVLSFGATGQLYTQITQDAPFQIFLSADDERPKKAVDDGLGVADSRFTYAIGKLVLWSKNADLVKGDEDAERRASSPRSPSPIRPPRPMAPPPSRR